MKNFPPQLLDFLLTHKAFNRADLFLIELTNGMVIASTSAQRDVDFGFQGTSPVIMQTYYTTLYGAWERGSVTSEASYAPKSNTMSLSVLAADSVNYPGTTTPLMHTVLAGLFDAAKVSVYTIYWDIGSMPEAGIEMGYEIKFVGQVSKVTDMSRDKVTFEVADMLYWLSTEVPLKLIQSSCRHTLFDPNCDLNQSSFAFSNFVASGSTPLLLNLSDDVTTAPYWNGVITFTQGKIQFTTGQNAGVWAFIKQLTSHTQILLGAPLPFPVVDGDHMLMYPGCDLTVRMCQLGYDNLINIGSTPFVPNPEVSL